LIAHGGKKIDVDDLKSKLAEGIRRGVRTGSTLDVSNSVSYGGSRENNMSMSNTFTRKSGKSATRSKSPGTFIEEAPERGSAAKIPSEGEPAWYRALKKNIK
jgi:hypothetical protein